MDSLVLKSFRQRLKRYGFTYIHLSCVHPPYDIYHLDCLDPRGFRFVRDLSLTQMCFEPQIVFFNKYRFNY